jgi:hypothetical protein
MINLVDMLPFPLTKE